MKKLFTCSVIITLLFTVTLEVIAAEFPQINTPYRQRAVDTVEELLEWIYTEDISDFQSGRYEKGILALRDIGYIFVPFFNCSNTILSGITVIPNDFGRNEYTLIEYIYFRDDEWVSVFVTQANKHLLNELNSDIREYVAHQHADDDIITPVLEITMTTHGQNRSVPYVIISRGPIAGSNAPPVQRAVFIIDGFEVRVSQFQDTWSDEHLSDLHLTMYDIATGEPLDTPPTTMPPNDNNGENGTEATAPTPTVEPTPDVEPMPSIAFRLIVALATGVVVIGGIALWLLLWKQRKRGEKGDMVDG